MTWGWAVRGDNLGTPAESAVKAAWPDYNAEYLKKKLNGQQRRFDPDNLNDGRHEVEKHVYLQEAVKGYEAEAEACLKEEFKQWLQGTHEANVEDEMGNGYYVNNDGGSGPKRRHVYDGVVSAEMADNGVQGTGWRATRWGTKQLTHLDGVRDFLRAGRIQQDNAERDMNLLAERGPQDLNEAWMYFKHWVKKRPVTTCDDECGESSKTVNKNVLDYFQVDRMNGTGPSNWNSQTKPTFDRPWEVPSWSAEDAPVKPEPPPLEPSVGNYYPPLEPSLANYYDLPPAPTLLRAALRQPDPTPPRPHMSGTKQKVAFTATASSPKRSNQADRAFTVYDRPIYNYPTEPISGTKHKGAHQMWTGQKDPNKVANTMPFKYGFQTDRGEKRPNPAMNHVWANNKANQALKRARCSGFQYDVNLMSSNRSPLPPTWQ